MIEAFRRHWPVFGAYLAIGTAVYWTALGAFFVSDDFEFLGSVARATTGSALQHPDAARFIRPLVVLSYWACYQAFGLNPLPYHVAVLLLHVFNACCVFLIARRLLPGGDRLSAALAGLLFLVFSSHSEAVAWAAGIADPLLAAFLLPAFLAYLRAVEPGAAGHWVWVSLVLMVTGAFAKESWVVFPALVLAHAVLLGDGRAQARKRTAMLIASSTLVVIAYLALRAVALGSVTGGYEGLSTSLHPSLFFGQVRSFVLRCFIPGGLRAFYIWQRGLDLVIWPALAVLVAVRGNRLLLRMVFFAGCGAALALAPVLPLTISLVNTESERFTYLATAFSCLLIVAAATAILRRRALVVLACAPLVVWHGVVLHRDAVRLRDAGQVAHGIIDSFATAVRQYDPEGRQRIFLLNLPDNLNGAYVYRRGFYPAVQLFAPDVGASTGRTIGIATTAIGSPVDRALVLRTNPNRFRIEFGADRIIQPQIPSSVWYRIDGQGLTGYEVEFADTARSAIVLYTSGGRVEYAGSVGTNR
jgi:protein O-mannosyl-transferase